MAFHITLRWQKILSVKSLIILIILLCNCIVYLTQNIYANKIHKSDRQFDPIQNLCHVKQGVKSLTKNFSPTAILVRFVRPFVCFLGNTIRGDKTLANVFFFFNFNLVSNGLWLNSRH